VSSRPWKRQWTSKSQVNPPLQRLTVDFVQRQSLGAKTLTAFQHPANGRGIGYSVDWGAGTTGRPAPPESAFWWERL